MFKANVSKRNWVKKRKGLNISGAYIIAYISNVRHTAQGHKQQ